MPGCLCNPLALAHCQAMCWFWVTCDLFCYLHPSSRFCNFSYGNFVLVSVGSSVVSNFLLAAVNVHGVVSCFSFEVRNEVSCARR